MITGTPHSFKWRLVRWLVLFETAAISLVIAIAVGLLWATGYLIDGYENGNIDVLTDAIVRDGQNNLVVQETPELARLRREVGEIWFIARDRAGHRLSEGAVPQAFAFATAGLDRMNDGRFRLSPDKDSRPEAVVKWVDSPAGNIQIFTGTEGQLTLRRLLLGTSGAFLTIFVPMLLLLALATIIVTPIVVRRMLAGLSHAAAHAAHIEFDQQGVQMPIKGVPAEFLPLVEAFNNALKRLDEGYARHKRFLAQAAHELRTPIAILNTRVATLPPSDGKARLIEDTNRLATLAGQLLDLQRLGKRTTPFCPLDLRALAERVIADLAPLAFAAGYEMSFDAADEPMIVLGDHSSLERALTNLVQNAIEHGGRRGKITFRVIAPARVEICDEGDGVPLAERERIFEPFSRLHPGGKGAGLGLSLVREIVHLHGGHVAIVDATSGGACFRIDLPPA
ncbi:HAMP domain-containing sensor histidine kinase [Ensifer sp. Root127]|uniref:sensor histidine kinase n=1 Tax=Ensifer sp. Root127 TaxID=1736440 RepID=UPI00070A6704|nr:HAMP domain-containing sensor histidine kinase [Ensifer sp. Root127]KQW73763.1 ATPase [Ensifer sp. Root127]